MTIQALALVEGGLLVGQEVPSLFGGESRFHVSAQAHKVILDDDGRLELTTGRAGQSAKSDTALVVDLARLIVMPEGRFADPSEGMKELAEKLVRPAGQVRASPSSPRARRAILYSERILAERLVEQVEDVPPGTPVFRRSAAVESAFGRRLDDVLLERGLAPRAFEDVITHKGRPVLFASPRSIYLTAGVHLERLCAHGQAASLAEGLAPAMVRKMVELGGPDVVELWEHSYNAHARAIAVQCMERELLSAMFLRAEGSTSSAGETSEVKVPKNVPLHVGGRLCRVFPPLPFSAFTDSEELSEKIERYRLAQDSKPKLEKLIGSLTARRAPQLEAFSKLLAVTVRIAVPELDDNRAWFERQDDLLEAIRRFAGKPIPALGVPYSSPLGRFITATGRSLSPLRPGWFRPRQSQTPGPASHSVPLPLPLPIGGQASTTPAPRDVPPPLPTSRKPARPAASAVPELPSGQTSGQASGQTASQAPHQKQRHTGSPAPQPKPTVAPAPAADQASVSTTPEVGPAGRAPLPARPPVIDPQVTWLFSSADLSSVEVTIDGDRVGQAQLALKAGPDGTLVEASGRDLRCGALVAVRYDLSAEALARLGQDDEAVSS